MCTYELVYIIVNDIRLCIPLLREAVERGNAGLQAAKPHGGLLVAGTTPSISSGLPWLVAIVVAVPSDPLVPLPVSFGDFVRATGLFSEEGLGKATIRPGVLEFGLV